MRGKWNLGKQDIAPSGPFYNPAFNQNSEHVIFKAVNLTELIDLKKLLNIQEKIFG